MAPIPTDMLHTAPAATASPHPLQNNVKSPPLRRYLAYVVSSPRRGRPVVCSRLAEPAPQRWSKKVSQVRAAIDTGPHEQPALLVKYSDNFQLNGRPFKIETFQFTGGCRTCMRQLGRRRGPAAALRAVVAAARHQAARDPQSGAE